MASISRRRLFEDSLLALAAASIPAAVPAGLRPTARRTVSPNEKLHIAVIGVNGRGMDHVRGYADMSDVVITAVCDADIRAAERAAAVVAKRGAPAPRTVQDIRRLLEDREIDAVSIATPNHWHALAAIWAIQAGKDVYVEKPVSHNVTEGRRIVQAARKHGRICQAGTQSRASKGLQEAMAYLHDGKMGRVTVARGLCYKRRKSIGKVWSEQPIPAGIDYNLWIGPAPMKPLMRRSLHYDWHWVWDTGNGDLGNQGIHQMDIARWGLGKKGFPNGALGIGGRFGYVDDGETPNTEISFLDYGDSQFIFEVRGLPTDALKPRGVSGPDSTGASIGVLFYGENGVMVVPSYSDAVVYDNSGHKVCEFHGGGDHYRNFIDAVRSRKRESLFADVEEGHVSSALCHLGNISYRLGGYVPFNPKTKAFGDNRDAYESFGRFEEHLATNGIQLANDYYRLGRDLIVDPRSESFVSDPEANTMLTREYRAPFVVPERV